MYVKDLVEDIPDDVDVQTVPGNEEFNPFTLDSIKINIEKFSKITN